MRKKPVLKLQLTKETLRVVLGSMSTVAVGSIAIFCPSGPPTCPDCQVRTVPCRCETQDGSCP